MLKVNSLLAELIWLNSIIEKQSNKISTADPHTHSHLAPVVSLLHLILPLVVSDPPHILLSHPLLVIFRFKGTEHIVLTHSRNPPFLVKAMSPNSELAPTIGHLVGVGLSDTQSLSIRSSFPGQQQLTSLDIHLDLSTIIVQDEPNTSMGFIGLALYNADLFVLNKLNQVWSFTW